MDVKMVAPFVDSFFGILSQFGFANTERGNLRLIENLQASNDVTTFIGLSEDIGGIVAFSMNEKTAKCIASGMMMGMHLDEFNEIAQSAISEMANLVAGNASIYLEQNGLSVHITPPGLIYGSNMGKQLCDVKTLVIEVLTEVGKVEIKVGIKC